MENLYPCSFKPEKCSCHGLRVVATVFVLYFFTSASSVISRDRLFQFLWLTFLDFIDSIFLLAPNSQYI